jgi:hypothetical protein
MWRMNRWSDQSAPFPAIENDSLSSYHRHRNLRILDPVPILQDCSSHSDVGQTKKEVGSGLDGSLIFSFAWFSRSHSGTTFAPFFSQHHDLHYGS